jgi:Zn-dependent alcohol dehydrogenase
VRITGSTVDFAFDCTGVIPVIEKLAQTVGMLGTLVLIGGAPAGATFSLDHLTTLWGKRVVGGLAAVADPDSSYRRWSSSIDKVAFRSTVSFSTTRWAI